MRYKTKKVPFELKDFDEETGIFIGYAAVFDNVDTGGDLIQPGAFTKTLQDNKDRVKICWQHDPYSPIGKPIEMREDEKGLFVKGQISDTSLGKDVKVLMKDGVINELSIGYDTVKKEWKNGVRHLKEIKLYEFSPVTWAMNDKAVITAVKSLDNGLELKENLTSLVEEMEIWDRYWNINGALSEIVYDLIDDNELNDNDKIITLAENLDQFKELMLDWFNRFLDLPKGVVEEIEKKDFSKEGEELKKALGCMEELEEKIKDRVERIEDRG